MHFVAMPNQMACLRLKGVFQKSSEDLKKMFSVLIYAVCGKRWRTSHKIPSNSSFSLIKYHTLISAQRSVCDLKKMHACGPVFPAPLFRRSIAKKARCVSLILRRCPCCQLVKMNMQWARFSAWFTKSSVLTNRLNLFEQFSVWICLKAYLKWW